MGKSKVSVELYRESEWASEASSITRFGKVRKMTNNLYCLIDREQDGRREEEENNGEGKEGETQCREGTGVDLSGHEVSLVTAAKQRAITQP